MNVTILGVMIPEIEVYGLDGRRLPADGWLVRLTLTEEKQRTAEPIRPQDRTKTRPLEDFENSVQKAFAFWDRKRGDVVWTLDLVPDDGRELPPLSGPSLSAAFAVALTLLHYRKDDAAALDGRFARSVLRADFSDVVVSAELRAPANPSENAELKEVGEFEWKAKGLEGRSLIASSQQPPINAETMKKVRLIEADTVKEAINKVFERQALNILQSV